MWPTGRARSCASSGSLPFRTQLTYKTPGYVWLSTTAQAIRSTKILIGGIEGDPGFEDNTGDGIIDNAIPAGPIDAVTNQIESTIVTLPDKTCNYCTVQWVWAARSDGGFYLGCADISITSTGLLPDFNLLPSEVGNELPQNAPPAPPGSVRGNGDGSGGGGGGAAIAIVVVLLVVGGGGGYWYYQNQQKQAGGSMPPMAPAQKGMPGGAPSLPPGWTAALDPASGRTYYSNAMTGATQWEPPVMPGGGGPPAPPPGAPPAPGSLPPGWTEAKDEGSGSVYYINTATGASTWERPTNRF